MLEKLNVQEFDDDKLVIHNVEIAGWIDDDKCRFCNHQRCYSERFDDYFCPYCNRWLESRCGDPNCGFCKDRPYFPNEQLKNQAEQHVQLFLILTIIASLCGL